MPAVARGACHPPGRKGLQCYWIDASEIMIEKAKRKAEQTNSNLDFRIMGIRDLHLNRAFDARICMFAVMNYVTENKDIQSAALNIRKHLEKDSLFIFDCWNGLAVLRILPSATVKTAREGS